MGYPKSIKVDHGKGIEEMPLADFENHFSIHYLPHLEFANYKVEQWLKKKCKKAHKRGLIAEYTLWLGHLHKKELSENILPALTIRYINDRIGYGLFTDKPLEPGQFVGEYTGLLRRRGHIFHKINDYCFMYPREWPNYRPLTIDGEKCGNETRFINHSDKPNVESLSVLFEGVFHLLFRTTKKVAAKEELTVDYGSIYWRRRQKIHY